MSWWSSKFLQMPWVGHSFKLFSICPLLCVYSLGPSDLDSLCLAYCTYCFNDSESWPFAPRTPCPLPALIMPPYAPDHHAPFPLARRWSLYSSSAWVIQHQNFTLVFCFLRPIIVTMSILVKVIEKNNMYPQEGYWIYLIEFNEMGNLLLCYLYDVSQVWIVIVPLSMGRKSITIQIWKSKEKNVLDHRNQ